MANDISLTVRLPSELNQQLITVSKNIGVTKTILIRFAIHEYLTDEKIIPDFSQTRVAQREKFVFNMNQLTYTILEKCCQKYGQSMNAIITAASILALEHFSKWLHPQDIP